MAVSFSCSPKPQITALSSQSSSIFNPSLARLSCGVCVSRNNSSRGRPVGVRMMAWNGPLSSVKLILQGKHLQLSDAVKQHAEDKVGKAIQKHTHLVREVDIRLSIRGGEFGKGPRIARCEVTLFTKKHGVVRAEEDADTLYGCIDLVSSVLQRKLRKIKEKDSDHGRHMKGFNRLRVRDAGALLVNDSVSEPVPVGEEEEQQLGAGDIVSEIVRTKHFEMPPLTVDEAIEQLENVDHDFYGFRDEETGQINIIYKREAGGYGLIIPKGNGETNEMEHRDVDSAREPLLAP